MKEKKQGRKNSRKLETNAEKEMKENSTKLLDKKER